VEQLSADLRRGFFARGFEPGDLGNSKAAYFVYMQNTGWFEIEFDHYGGGVLRMSPE
jgi:hypothetical protein